MRIASKLSDKKIFYFLGNNNKSNDGDEDGKN